MQPPQNLLVTITYTLLWKLSAIAQPACETFPTRETCTCHSRSNLDGSKSLPHKDLYRQSLLSSRRIASAQSCHLFTSKCLLWDLKCSNAPKWYNDLVGYNLPNKKNAGHMLPERMLVYNWITTLWWGLVGTHTIWWLCFFHSLSSQCSISAKKKRAVWQRDQKKNSSLESSIPPNGQIA